MTHPGFNLVDEPWLRVVRSDGSPDELSLAELFTQAHDLRELVDDSPLITVALHRLLLAIVHRVVDGPRSEREWRNLWKQGLPTAEICAYLARWRHRFDLFDAEHPFFQVGGLETVDKKGRATDPAPITVLRPDMASGNNGVLFSHDLDTHVNAWTPEEAARALIGCQAFTLGGGKGPRTNRFGEHPYASHATQVGGILALLQGADVQRTLLLNTLVVTDDEPVKKQGNDAPVWEREAVRAPGKVTPDGYLDYLTLPCRTVRLIPEPAADGGWHVRTAYVAQGCAIDDEAGVVSPLWVKRLDKVRGTVPLALRAERAVWRDASALFGLAEDKQRFDPRPAALSQSRSGMLARTIGEDTRLRVRCYGLVNDKAKPVAWRSEDLPASVRMLQDGNLVATVRRANAFAEDSAWALNWGLRVCAQTLLETDQKSPDKNDVTRLVERMTRHSGFWDGLERPFRTFLADLAPDTRDALLQGWVDQIEDRARESYRRAARFAQGSLARRLRATVAGESALHSRLTKLRVDLFPPEPAPPSSTLPTGAAHG